MNRPPSARPRRSLGPGTADRVRLLIEERVGPGFWDGFQAYMTEPLPWHEWRFGGTLGFGGKLHLSAGRLYVSAYPEDIARDPAIASVIEDLNAKLAEVMDAAS